MAHSSAFIVETRADEAFRNLAVEEFLFDRGAPRPTLFLYVNAAAVVIGKNQNPWRECRADRIRSAGLALARRASGGGAVYHDPGNLNYSLVYARAAYRPAEAFELAIGALARLGARARLSDKTSLTLDGLKISGTAFALRGRAALHHGTVLVRADLDRLRGLFPGDLNPIETHAVASVPAAVANLADAIPGLAVSDVAAAFRQEFEARYGVAVRVGDAEIEHWDWRAAYERLRSERWIYGRTPAFTLRRPGARSICVEEGVIVSGPPAEWIGRPFREFYEVEPK